MSGSGGLCVRWQKGSDKKTPFHRSSARKKACHFSKLDCSNNIAQISVFRKMFPEKSTFLGFMTKYYVNCIMSTSLLGLENFGTDRQIHGSALHIWGTALPGYPISSASPLPCRNEGPGWFRRRRLSKNPEFCAIPQVTFGGGGAWAPPVRPAGLRPDRIAAEYRHGPAKRYSPRSPVPPRSAPIGTAPPPARRPIVIR